MQTIKKTSKTNNMKHENNFQELRQMLLMANAIN